MTMTMTMTRYRPLGPLDLPWVLMDTRRHPMHVAGLIICRPPDDAAADFVAGLVQDMRGFTASTDPFNRRLHRRGRGSIWPHWETVTGVHLDQHVHHDALPAPGDERELRILVSALHRTPLDLTQPLWQIHVIEGLEQNRFAIYAKFHHCLVDGIGAIRILQSAFSTDSSALDTPPIWAYRRSGARRPPPSRRRDSVRAIPRAVHAAADHTFGRAAAKPYSAPRSILNIAITSERTVSTVSCDLGRLRRLAAAMHGSINDAYVTVCSTALRNFLIEVDALPARPLTATLPVSVRTADGEDLGNAITFAFVSLASDISNCRERTARIIASTTAAKARLAGLPKQVIDAYTVLTMAPFIASQILGLGARTAPMFNVAISNIPGPREPLFYNRAPVLEIFPVSILQSGQALNITALSYADRLNITFTACDAFGHDVHRLALHCTEALAELEAEFTPGNAATGPTGAPHPPGKIPPLPQRRAE